MVHIEASICPYACVWIHEHEHTHTHTHSPLAGLMQYSYKNSILQKSKSVGTERLEMMIDCRLLCIFCSEVHHPHFKRAHSLAAVLKEVLCKVWNTNKATLFESLKQSCGSLWNMTSLLCWIAETDLFIQHLLQIIFEILLFIGYWKLLFRINYKH